MTDRARRCAALALGLALLAAPPMAAAAPSIQMSGSVYVDDWIIPGPPAGARAPQGLTPDAAIKLGLDVHDELTFSIKACVGCHGVEVEHAALDYQPRSWFNVQIGRLAIPFGEYSNRVDPSGHKTASAPLIYDMGRMAYADRASFNSGVVMLPYVDTGALVYGQVFLGTSLQVWYAGYAVSGYKGSNDVDWVSLRSPPYVDNNDQPSYGGRLALTLGSNPGALLGDVSLGASYTGGRYDRAAGLRYDAVGADASIVLWKLTLRGEWALRRTRLNTAAAGYQWQVVDPFFDKSGFYLELEHPLGRYLALVYRYDRLDRKGVPLPGSSAQMTPDARLERATAGLVLTPAAAVFVKLSYEYWRPSLASAFHSGHVGLGGAF